MLPAYPTTMRALFLVKKVTTFQQEDLASCFEVREIDVPTPKYGEVLVKVECSPINPSNLSMLQGKYNSDNDLPLPSLTGTEGSGVVVASGGGIMGWYMVGKRVGIVKSDQGLWAEYVTVPAMTCIKLPHDVSFEGGSSCFVNPLTVVAFVELALARGTKAIVHTAGASALGKMLVKHAKDNGVDVIAVVRRREQAESLQTIGAKYIVDTSESDWKAQLTTLTESLGATLAFDAVAGSLTGDVLTCMPNGSEVQVYGGLSNQPVSGVSPSEMIFKGKNVTGFWLVPYLAKRGTLGRVFMIRKVTGGLNSAFKTTISKAYPLEDTVKALHDYTGNMSDNKVAFKPSQTA
ncbi:hypothetical protein DYB25_009574 [Aphanomyces astaci]|uniref:Enoyl reductase (ER) domain-containing protein n=1 Tax=Aphanomyces astaci TaxID=112090 RepID=A0A397AH06_APHAT|nr:hypothetical protein DYB25_009574 [Aphanomyces astaci]RHY77192.1 hypothetical protein DYB34_008140 [Aphanomyces astaci]